ncbi:MAG: hypothetical protein DRP03_02695 [Candidatus Aenigmatarchaeota archaeon]|nr:MAG: hypothetical protein DRP03_02695 [Candidatus Aenigmarchaeota archaeon]
MVFEMEDETRKKEVKQIVYLLAFVWILNIAIWGYLFYFRKAIFQITPIIIIGLSPLLLIPVVMVGLWSFKKWGLILGYILSVIALINSLLSFNLIGIIIWGVILYYLYKSRVIFS